MFFNTWKKITFIFLVFVGLALFWILISLASNSGHRPTFPASVPPKEKKEYDIIDQWSSVAQECNLPEQVVNKITLLMEKALERRDQTRSRTLNVDLRPSLRDFLQQFGNKFNNPQEKEGFSYTVVWLIAEAVGRKKVAQDILDQAKKEFGEYLNTLDNRMRSDFRKQLGPDFAKFESLIEEGITRIKQTLMQRFEILQANPLYPAFKGPLNKEALDKAIEVVLSPKGYPKYEEPKRMMILKERVYAGRLKGFFKTCPTLILYEATRHEIDPRIWNNPYWDPMDYYTASTLREYIWPIEIVFTPKKEPDTN